MSITEAFLDVLKQGWNKLKQFLEALGMLFAVLYGCYLLLRFLAPEEWSSGFWAALLPLYPYYRLSLRRSRLRSDKRGVLDAALAVLFGTSIGLLYSGQFIVALCLAAGAFLALLTLDRAAANAGDGDSLRRRGTKRITLQEARRAAAALASRGEATLPWGGIEIPATLGRHGFLIIGAQGSGKTSFLLILLKRMLEQAATNPDTRFYMFDAKGTLLPAVRQLGSSLPIRHVHPFAADGLAWDLAQDIDSEADAEEVARILFRPEKGGQPFFEGAAQALLAAVIVSLMELRPRQWTFRDAMLALADLDDMQRIVGATDSAVNRSAMKTFFSSQDPRLGANVGAGLTEKARHFWTIAARWHHQAKLGRKLSLKQWLRERSILVFGHSHRAQGALENLHAAFFKCFSQRALDLPNKSGRQIVVAIDELASAGHLGSLQAFIAKGRERGLIPIVGAQQVAPLREMYGDHGADAVLALLSFIGGLHVPDAVTAKWLSDRFGEREHWEPVESHSMTRASQGGSTSESRSWQTRRDPAYLPSDFQTLALVNPSTDTGPNGYFLAPDIGAYHYGMTFKELVRLTPKPVEGGPERGDPKLDRLMPWTDEERAALGLPPARSRPRRAAGGQGTGDLDLR